MKDRKAKTFRWSRYIISMRTLPAVIQSADWHRTPVTRFFLFHFSVMSRDVHPTANQKRRWKQVNKEIFSPFLIFFLFFLYFFFFEYSNSTQFILTNQFYFMDAQLRKGRRRISSSGSWIRVVHWSSGMNRPPANGTVSSPDIKCVIIYEPVVNWYD